MVVLKGRQKVLLVVFAMGLSLRGLTAVILPLQYCFTDDAVEYVSVAHHLLEQGVFGEKKGAPYAAIPPGYPLLVAAVLWATRGSLMALRLVQVGLATVIIWLLYLIGCQLRSRRVGLLAAGAFAIYPPWILWPSLFLTETLFTTVLLVLVLAILWLLRSPSWRPALAVGGMLGLATLVREMMAPFVLAVPLLLALSRVRWRTALKATVAAILAMAAVLSPWVIRNAATFGSPFLSERLEAVRYRLTGSGYLGPRYWYLADPGAPEPVRRPDTYRRRFGERPTALLSVRTLINDPGMYMACLVHRIQRLWLHPVGLVSVPGGAAGRGAYVAVQCLLLLLAGIGFADGLRRRNASWGTILAVVLFGTVVILAVAWPHPRYSLPFVPLVILAGVHGVGVACRWISRGDVGE